MSSENSKTDRRINRTRRQLRDALMGLVLERGYSAVTIEDITERADLGRTTFYLHFRDKEELLVESLKAIAEDLKAQVEQLADQSLEECEVYPRFRRNRGFYPELYRCNGNRHRKNSLRE